MNLIKFILLGFSLLFISCSSRIALNNNRGVNNLHVDSVKVYNFISRIEKRFDNYYDSYKNTMFKFNEHYEFNDSSKYYPSPNPFSPTTTISFSMQKSDTVEMVLNTFDGLDSCTVYSGTIDKGINNINFYFPQIPEGVYFFITRFKSGGKEVKKLLLLK